MILDDFLRVMIKADCERFVCKLVKALSLTFMILDDFLGVMIKADPERFD